MFFNPFDQGSVSLSIVGGSAVTTRHFVGDIESEVVADELVTLMWGDPRDS